MVRNKRGSWLEYMRQMQLQSFSPEQMHVEGLEQMLNINHYFQSVFHHSIPMMYLVDYTAGKYLTVSRSVELIMGHRSENFTQAGVPFTVEHYHKDDLRLFNEQIFPDRLAFLKSLSPAEHPNYIFSYHYRFRNKENRYINLLQRNCFIKSDENGNPLLSLGMVVNIDHFKNEGPVTQVIERTGNQPGEVTQTINKRFFYLHEEDKLFTRREREVLLWIADGLTGKEIADKLYLSENTIINHRRNMQEKSNTKNVAELVSFAFRQGII